MGSKVDRNLAYELIEQGILAIEGNRATYERALSGRLGRPVRLHHEVDTGYQDPGVLESPTAPLTLLREFLESIDAVEPDDRGEWWVRPSAADADLADTPARSRDT